MLPEFDNAVFDSLKQGCSSAFRLLVESYEGPLFRFFYCRDGNWHLAEEQTAETFSQLITSLPRIQGGPEKLRAYIFSIARHVRSRKLRKAQTKEISAEFEAELTSSDVSPAENLVLQEQVSQLLQAVKQLEPNVRMTVLLRYVEDFSIREISEALDFPEGTIKSHLHRGKRRLKQLLQESECES